MEKTFLSRQYLESIATADLISLADDYGIDIPDNLNRRFIIGELLEAADEIENERKADKDVTIKDATVEVSKNLPPSYNETQISVMLRNPAWAFVFWDIKEADLRLLQADRSFISLFLHVSFFESQDMEKTADTFDVQISINDREQYVLVPGGKKYFTIDLAYSQKNSAPVVLAKSRCMEIPCGNKYLSKLQPGKEVDVPELLTLSGMEQLLHDHYNNHRQSFGA
jgi:hypothetical protein